MPYAALPTLTESLDSLQRQLRAERNAERRRRLHALVLIASGAVTTRGHIADHLMVHRNTVSRWLLRYQCGGIEALFALGKTGPPPGQRIVPTEVFEALRRRLSTPVGFASYEAVQRWLADEYAIALTYTSVHRLVRYRAGATLKVSRPEHPKKASPKRRTSPSVSVVV